MAFLIPDSDGDHLSFYIALGALVLSIAGAVFPFILALQCVAALLPARRTKRGNRRQVVVLIPAHDESAGIASTIASILKQLEEQDRVVVVADNCSDNTAQLAKEAGAEVVERTDTARRGKGFALDAGLRYIKFNPPDVVIVFDADCVAEPGMVDELVRAADGSGKPVQALYLMRLMPNSGPETTVSVFAFLVKNWVRARAMQRLCAPVLLTGSGMAFPWRAIQQVDLANGEIVEDLALGLELTRQGYAPQFCEKAVLWSELPSTEKAAIKQRTRWEHGYISIILKEVPRLILQAFRGRYDLFIVAFDLAVPPLSLLVLLSILVASTVFFLSLWTAFWLPFYLLVGIGCLCLVAVSLCWARFARNIVPLDMIASIPRYVFGKIGLYRSFIRNRETNWVRTERRDSNES